MSILGGNRARAFQGGPYRKILIRINPWQRRGVHILAQPTKMGMSALPHARGSLKRIIHVESCRVSGIFWWYRAVVLLKIAVLNPRQSRNSKSLCRESSHEVAVIPRAPSRIAPSDLNSAAAHRRYTGIYGDRSRR